MDALNIIINRIEELGRDASRVIIAIDGKSGTGKSHLSRMISSCMDASVVHMDDFFLPSYKRTEDRFSIVGGNLDSERFYSSVIEPLQKGCDFFYNPYDCKSDTVLDKKVWIDRKIVIIEGVYALLPPFRSCYSAGYILEGEYSQRLDRIWARSGEELLKRFINEWIPQEDRYFDSFDFSGYERIVNF